MNNKIIEKLEAQIEAGNKYLYLSGREWSAYAQMIPEEIKQSYRKYGYMHVINPETNDEEDVLIYKIFPVLCTG